MTSETETVADVLDEMESFCPPSTPNLSYYLPRIAAAHARELKVHEDFNSFFIGEGAWERFNDLNARILAAEKDAARYRWLREAAGSEDSWNVELREPDGDDGYIGTYLFDDSLDDAIDAAMPRVEVGEARKELAAWSEMVTMAHINRDGLWPNNWPQNVTWIAYCLHTGSVPPRVTQSDNTQPLCVHCNQPTMHIGNVCYACSHPAMPRVEVLR